MRLLHHSQKRTCTQAEIRKLEKTDKEEEVSECRLWIIVVGGCLLGRTKRMNKIRRTDSDLNLNFKLPPIISVHLSVTKTYNISEIFENIL